MYFINRQFKGNLLSSTLFVLLILSSAVCFPNNAAAENETDKTSEELARQKREAEWEAEFRAKYSDIKEYVKQGNVQYSRTREMFDKDSLPKLYELLKDDDYSRNWHTAAQVIRFYQR